MVFFVRPIGFIVPTAARRISYGSHWTSSACTRRRTASTASSSSTWPPPPVAERAAPIADEIAAQELTRTAGAGGHGDRGRCRTPAQTTWATKRWSPWCSRTSGGPRPPARYRSPHAISVRITGYRSRPAAVSWYSKRAGWSEYWRRSRIPAPTRVRSRAARVSRGAPVLPDHLVEPAVAEEDLAHGEQGPLLAHDLERAGDGARSGLGARATSWPPVYASESSFWTHASRAVG